MSVATATLVMPLRDLGRGDVGRVGGKNASLGEMLRHLSAAGIRVPDGFATTAAAYWHVVDANGLRPKLRAEVDAFHQKRRTLQQTGEALRRLFLKAEFPADLRDAILAAYRDLGEPDAAVRSSATAEDLPNASFAGQQESYLHIQGGAALLDACRRCMASLFTDRAISYREAMGFDHLAVALSVGVQRMVRSDAGSAGVMFTIDTETGFPDAIVINAAYGLGETVVQGRVDPDEYQVFKPHLGKSGLKPMLKKTPGAKAQKLVYDTAGGLRLEEVSEADRRRCVLEDDAIFRLAEWGAAIERHYGMPMDIEWAREADGGLFIVQARPETVQSRQAESGLVQYVLEERAEPLLRGVSVGTAIAAGPVCRIDDPRDGARMPAGAVLVAKMTDPDWVPVLKRAAAVVTDHGGRTCHAAIISRELGIPAIVGAADGTRLLADGRMVTVSCAEGDQGAVYPGALRFRKTAWDPRDVPATRTPVMLNIASPEAAMRWWRLPADGIGLARLEFLIDQEIRVHPMALARFGSLRDIAAREKIAELTAGCADKTVYFVERLARGTAAIAASQYPRPVIVRLSDFKTNEYAGLLGGAEFEPSEENPMIGFRGASRYAHPRYAAGFALECRAMRMAREEIGMDNIILMIPFCRTLAEADAVLAEMRKHGLERGRQGLQIYCMCEIPSNVILAAEFLERFDGYSIGSNDLTQLTLGIDRDSALLAGQFDEDNPAVRRLIETAIREAKRAGRKIGLCGQAPSDRPEFAAFLMRAGIDSISVNPDSFARVKRHLAAAEQGGRA